MMPCSLLQRRCLRLHFKILGARCVDFVNFRTISTESPVTRLTGDFFSVACYCFYESHSNVPAVVNGEAGSWKLSKRVAVGHGL